jgi:parallel beta-helix repeat protein
VLGVNKLKRGARILIGISLFLFLFTVSVNGATINVPTNHSTIQAAINAANPGDTINVSAGTYNENIDINKSINLVGAGADVTTIKASNPNDHVIEITANGVNVSGFTVGGAKDWPNSGIYLNGANYCTIANNNILINQIGIFLNSSSNNTLNYNTASNNKNYGISLVLSSNNTLNNNTGNNNGLTGIILFRSNNNTLNNNTASNNNLLGIRIQSSRYNTLNYNTANSNTRDGILLDRSSNNNLHINTVNNNFYGIYLALSSNNTIKGNNASSNTHGITIDLSNINTINNNIANNNANNGIFLTESSNNTLNYNTANNNIVGISLFIKNHNNTIYHNNFINNTLQAQDTGPSSNFWHHPTLLEGNYWSDYTGVDDGSGTGKHAISGDYIGDTVIPHPTTNFDNYPFIYENGWTRPIISIYTNKPNYTYIDVMHVGLDISNPGETLNVGLYVWVDLPGGGKKWVLRKPSVNLGEGLDFSRPWWKTHIFLDPMVDGAYAWHAVIYDHSNSEMISESILPWTCTG